MNQENRDGEQPIHQHHPAVAARIAREMAEAANDVVQTTADDMKLQVQSLQIQQ